MKNKPKLAIIGAVPPPSALAMIMAIEVGRKIKKLDLKTASKKATKAKAKEIGFIKTGEK